MEEFQSSLLQFNGVSGPGLKPDLPEGMSLSRLTILFIGTSSTDVLHETKLWPVPPWRWRRADPAIENSGADFLAKQDEAQLGSSSKRVLLLRSRTWGCPWRAKSEIRYVLSIPYLLFVGISFAELPMPKPELERLFFQIKLRGGKEDECIIWPSQKRRRPN